MSSPLVPLVVALPLVVAALLAAGGKHLPRLLPDSIAIACAATVTAMTLVLLLRSGDHTLVYWFGGWRPTHGFALGIDFSVDPLAAGEATLAALAVLAALVFAWGHFEHVRHLFHSLMLAFLGGMIGFTLSGDLFNIFVFLELMGIAAYALSGYRVERPDVLQGALNFAILNSLGSFTLLMGIAMLYGRTGSLNLVNIGQALQQHHSRALLVATLTCVTVGFLVKAGAAPFHFWLSDAYAVATAPVAAVFTAVMSDLAFDVYSRVYTTVFEPSLGGERALPDALIALALLSAVVGAVMCFFEADLKRQLAFLTISNGGVVLAGIASLGPTGLGGSMLYITAAGLLRGALMLTLGLVTMRLGSSDELSLRGKGRRRADLGLGLVVVACALGLAAPPGFGSFLAGSMVYNGLAATPYAWVVPILAASVAISAGAVIRGTARIFLGWGPARDPALTRQSAKVGGSKDDSRRRVGRHHPIWTLAAPIPLVVASYFLAFSPGLAGHAIKAASDLQDHAAHARLVLHGVIPPPHPPPHFSPGWRGWGFSIASFAGAMAVAAAGLWWQRLKVARRAWELAVWPVKAVKALHSGSVGDYCTWMAMGMAALGATWALTLR